MSLEEQGHVATHDFYAFGRDRVVDKALQDLCDARLQELATYDVTRGVGFEVVEQGLTISKANLQNCSRRGRD